MSFSAERCAMFGSKASHESIPTAGTRRHTAFGDAHGACMCAYRVPGVRCHLHSAPLRVPLPLCRSMERNHP